MKRIVVPIDGSGFADRAIPLAADLANRLGASLSLVTVYEPRYDHRVFGDEPRADYERDATLRYLEDRALQLGRVGGVPVIYEMLQGYPAEALSEWIERSHPDLVVMTTHGRGPWSRFWLGSVADYLLKRTTRPILLLRPDEQTADSLGWKRILVPVDLSVGSATVLESIGPMARLFEAEVSLLHVVAQARLVGDGLGAPPPDYADRLRREAEASLAAQVDQLRAQGIRASFRVRIAEGAAEAIVAEVATGEFNAVALATRAPTGLARLVLGSVADKVVRAVGVPVLVTHVPTATPG
ncbi:MAG: universal stress protein [Gemmatimonadales bacterium]